MDVFWRVIADNLRSAVGALRDHIDLEFHQKVEGGKLIQHRKIKP
jgi:hypothetical protein